MLYIDLIKTAYKNLETVCMNLLDEIYDIIDIFILSSLKDIRALVLYFDLTTINKKFY